MSTLILETKLETVTRGQIVVIVFFLAIAASMTLWISGEIVNPDELSEVIPLLSIYFIVPIAAVLFTSWIKTFTTLQVHSDRVEVINRFLVRNSRRIEASKIESVNFSQSLLGRSRYGTLTVRGSGLGAIVLTPIRKPEEVAEVVRGIADKSSAKTSAPVVQVASSDTQSLSELIAMKEKGHLTEEEFTAAKKKLLG